MRNLFRKYLRPGEKAMERQKPGFRVAPDVKSSRHADGVVLIHVGKGLVFSANRAGAMIWNGASQGQTLDEVTQSISSAFHIPAQTAQRDAAEFLEQLTAEGLLVSSNYI